MHPRYGRRLPLSREQGLLVASGAWLIPTITVVAATLIHLFDQPRDVPFFISETDYRGLQDLVFTAGLTLGGVCQMAYAWHLYHALEAARPRAWFVASLLGVLASANTVLVSHYDMYDHINPHILTAMLAFGGRRLGLHRRLGHGRQGHDAGRRMRSIGFTMAAAGFIVMLVAFQSAASTVDPTGLTTVEFLNQAQSGIVVAAPADAFSWLA